MSLQTSFTSLLGIKTPIVAAPMAGASGGALAAEVTNAGGFGFLSAGYDSVDALKRELKAARDILQAGEQDTLRVGVGFLCWQLEKDPAKADNLLLTTLEHKPQAVWFSFGENLGRWVDFVRKNDSRAGTRDFVKVFVQISTAQDLILAINTWKVDVIVIQGNESGGHGLSNSLPLLTLFPLLSRVAAERNGPPLLAAGGIATGAQVASLLTLGASGAVLGTRFLMSPESFYSDVQRRALAAADSSQSVRTMAFDHARNTLGWPEGVDGRGLRNATVDDFERGEDLTSLREKFVQGTRAADPSRMLVWAGSSVGLTSKIMPAKDIVNELHEECIQTLRAARKILVE